MVKIEKEAEHTLLREGVPAIDEIKEIEPKYFKFSINDPEVKKITVYVRSQPLINLCLT